MKYYFDVLQDVSDSDAIIIAQSLPALTGNGTVDLHCGSCEQVLAAKLTPKAICEMFKVGDSRLILRCTCEANNLVECDNSAVVEAQ